MDFYGNLKSHLTKQVHTDINRLNNAYKNPENLDTDMAFFGDLVKQQRLSVIALNEQIRSKHTMLKIALDGVQ